MKLTRLKVIEHAFQVAAEHPNVWGPDLWDRFTWAFANVYQRTPRRLELFPVSALVYNRWDLSATLTKEELEYVRVKMNIPNSYQPTGVGEGPKGNQQ